MGKLSDYRLGERLHDGAAHDVIRGTTSDGRAVILKLLRQLHPSPSQVARFEHEYGLLRRVDSDRVVKAYDFATDRRRWAIVQEDFGGVALSRQLGDADLSLPERVDIAIEIADALDELHAAGVIHKDINPSNIVRNAETGQLKLIDLGLATALTSESPSFSNRSDLEGTLRYISPEQTGRVAAVVDHRSDLYSLGVTLYELFARRLPFELEDAAALVHAHIARTPRPLAEVAEVPETLSRIVMRLLSKAVDARYQSARGLRADLERCRAQLRTGADQAFELARDDAPSRLLIPSRLYGREAPTASLIAALDRAVGADEGGLGSTAAILVTGPAGMGKSSLVKQLYRPLTARRGYFVSGKFEQFRRAPFSAFVNAFRELIIELLGASGERLERLRNDLEVALGPNGRVINDVIPQLELIIGRQPPVEALGAAETLNRFERTFSNFVRVFARPHHPVVLFVDDLQWADGASASLMRGLIAGQDMSLLIIGAYRDDEVDANHPLSTALEALEADGHEIPRVTLSPLTTGDVATLIGDATRADAGPVAPLAELVVRNTGGNPLFVRELIKALAQDGLLRRERASGTWSWDLDEIVARGFTDSVLELMTARLADLTDRARRLLQFAACVGITFDTELLAALTHETAQTVLDRLRPAIHDGVVVAPSARDGRLHFFHDRVQQAAYEGLEKEERARTHLAIGRRLRSDLGDAGTTLFDVVFQLNRGSGLITDDDERLTLARLNLEAGSRAAASAANDAARRYFDGGLAMLPDDAWSAHYELKMALMVGAAAALYAVADHERAEVVVAESLTKARTGLEKADLYVSIVQQRTASGRYPEALDAAREGLALVGFELVSDGYMDAMMRSFGELQERLGGMRAADFLERPFMTDPQAIARTRLLSWSMAAAFYLDPLLYSVISFEAMKLTADHGNSRDATALYAQYGHLLGALFGDPVGGYEYTVLSRELCDRLGNRRDKAEACFLSANFSLAWVRSLREARAINREGLQAGIESGGLQFARYCACYLAMNDLNLGEPLEDVLRDSREYLAQAVRQKDQIAQASHTVVGVVANNLAGNTSSVRDFACDGVGDGEIIAQAAANQTMMVAAYLYALECAALVTHGDWEAALEISEKGMELLPTIPGQINAGRIVFHTAVALAASAGKTPDGGLSSQDLARLQRADELTAQLAGFAANCEANWAHTEALVRAEIARARGDDGAAIEQYERAVRLAEEHEWTGDHTLACERAGRYWHGKGRSELSRGYLSQARYGYERWGARRKLSMLDAEFPGITPQEASPRRATGGETTSLTTTESASEALDLAAVLRASQALSGELALEPLLGRLLELVLESAGAQHGVMIVMDDGELVVRAAGSLEHDEEGEQVLRSDVTLNVSLQSFPNVSAAIVNYVARTGDPLVLTDASDPGPFAGDPYLRRSEGRSVLCLPLRAHGEVFGALYLENRAVQGAFSPHHLEVVRLLASQFAISFENARLYNDMETRVAQRTDEIALKNRELSDTLDELQVAQKRLMASNAFIRKTFGRYVSDDVVQHLLESPEALELGGERRPLTVLASDVRGFTALAERLDPEAVITLLNGYFEAMFKVIHRHGGTINAILGDGLFVFFGVPVALPKAPRRAVACALEMMAALDVLKASGDAGLRELEMGIGVHTGVAVVGNIGSHDRTKYSAVGLDVNLAARIEGCTVGGQILISQATAEAAGAGIRLSPAMELAAKGVAQPLTLFAIEGMEGGVELRGDPNEPLRALQRPIPVVFNVVSGAVVAPAGSEGQLVALSRSECELASTSALAPRTDLRIRLLEAGEPGDVYGKVLSHHDGTTRLRFTSVPPGVRQVFEQVARS